MAKSIKKKTDKEARKELRKSGELKGLSRKEKKMAVKKAGFQKRNIMRAEMSAEKRADKMKLEAAAGARRMKAQRSGQRLAYDVGHQGRYQGTPSEVMNKIQGTSGTFGNRGDNTPTRLSQSEGAANKKAHAAAKPGDTYEITRPDGTKKTVRKKDPNKDYSKAKYGAKVKAVKKAKNGASTDPTKKEGIKAKDIKETLKTAFIPGYAIKKGYDYLKGKASTNQKAIDDARNKKATEMQKKKLAEMREDRSKRADWSGKYKEELVKATKESGAETAQEVALKKVVSGPKSEKKAMMKTRGKLVKRDKKIVLPKKKQITKLEKGGKVKKRTTTVTENTPSRFSKFTDAQKAQIKARGEKKTGEDKKDFDYDVARSKDTKSKTTTTTKRRSGKVKSVSVTEKRKSLNSGKSTDVTTASKKRRGGSTRVKTTSYGAGDDKDSGRVVKQKYNRKGELRKTKVIKKGVQNN